MNYPLRDSKQIPTYEQSARERVYRGRGQLQKAFPNGPCLATELLELAQKLLKRQVFAVVRLVDVELCASFKLYLETLQ